MTAKSMKERSRVTKKEIVTAFRTREILAAARQVMDQRGVEAVTMEEIAAAAGVAKGTLYLYFRGREDLIQALVSQVVENLLRDLEAILAEPYSPPEKLRQIVTMLLKYLERERILFPVYARELLRGDRPVRKGHWLTIRDLEEKFVSLLTGFFAEGIEAGQFIEANPRLLTFLLRGLVRGVGYYQIAGGRKEEIKEALPTLITLISCGMARPGQSSAEVEAK
jgi:TetR/AcrR family fatty acid metabolism transcriptional regulator